jgi:hypothetical protein
MYAKVVAVVINNRVFPLRDDDEDDDQQTPRRRGGRGKKDASYANLDDIDDVGTPNSSQAPSVTGVANADPNGTYYLLRVLFICH